VKISPKEKLTFDAKSLDRPTFLFAVVTGTGVTEKNTDMLSHAGTTKYSRTRKRSFPL
jgi:hypothetical protein